MPVKLSLVFALSKREVSRRYRGSLLGIFWSLLNPLFMLGVYTLVFGVVMKVHWSVPGRGTEQGISEFSVILFAGLIVFQVFSDAVIQSTDIIVANSNYVKRIVFPLQILPVVNILAAVFQAFISLFVLLLFVLYAFDRISLTVVLAPVVLAPLLLMVLGISWFFAAVGVFVRDIGQLIQPVVTATMFLSPVLFSAAAAPEAIRSVLFLNPLTVPVENFRNVVVFGVLPDWQALGIYTVVAGVIAVLGYQFFQKARKGFADVL